MAKQFVRFEGILGKDVEMSYATTGKALSRGSLGVSFYEKAWKDIPEKKVTVWVNFTAFGDVAEQVKGWTKGSKVVLEGTATMFETYTNKAGVTTVQAKMLVDKADVAEENPNVTKSAPKATNAKVLPKDWSKEAHAKAVKEGESRSEFDYWSEDAGCWMYWSESDKEFTSFPF